MILDFPVKLHWNIAFMNAELFSDYSHLSMPAMHTGRAVCSAQSKDWRSGGQKRV